MILPLFTCIDLYRVNYLQIGTAVRKENETKQTLKSPAPLIHSMIVY